jgi:hypothetical protein
VTGVSTTATDRQEGSALEALRAFGVMLGGPTVLAGIAALSIGGTGRAIADRRWPRPGALAGLAGLAAYALLARPWLENWGSSEDERSASLPGDELVPEPGIQTTRAVTIDAPVDEVWPWLAQIGQDRAGFYSYEWLENLAGCRMRNADVVHPEWQRREVGETVLLHPMSGLKLARFEPPHSYAFEGWYFALKDDGEWTRLLARGRCRKGLAAAAYALLLELPHFVMERKMLLGIKHRAELRCSLLEAP